MLDRIYWVLDHSLIYRWVGRIAVWGGREGILRIINSLLASLPPAERLLDVGCGPASRLFPLGIYPIGVDLSASYVREYVRQGALGVIASADALPFPSNCFDGVWSVGLFHHLSDAVAAAAIQAMVNVAKPDGYVVILDAVLPRRWWHHPVAALVRRLDRGRFMRTQEQFEKLLPSRSCWFVDRQVYSLNGMELLIARVAKEHLL